MYHLITNGQLAACGSPQRRAVTCSLQQLFHDHTPLIAESTSNHTTYVILDILSPYHNHQVQMSLNYKQGKELYPQKLVS